MIAFFKKIFKAQKGQGLILGVFIIIMLITFAGLAIDVGMITYHKQKLQDALDLTALAAVHEVGNPRMVEEAAGEFAKKNGIAIQIFRCNYPYNGDYNKVEVFATETVNLAFLSIIGFETKDVSARAVAMVDIQSETIVGEQALDYAIFNGSTSTNLEIKGNGATINGNVHSNKGVAQKGSGHTINGNLTAVSGISGNLSAITVNGTIDKSASFVPMPDLKFDEYASKSDKVINGDTIFNNLLINGIILVNGNCKINAAKVKGKGILLVNGDVDIATPNLEYSSEDDMLAIYSNSNITISSNSCLFHGVLYAPYGQIEMMGSNNTIYGAVIADEVVSITKEVTISANYDIRVPQAFSVSKTVFRLTE